MGAPAAAAAAVRRLGRREGAAPRGWRVGQTPRRRASRAPPPGRRADAGVAAAVAAVGAAAAAARTTGRIVAAWCGRQTCRRSGGGRTAVPRGGRRCRRGRPRRPRLRPLPSRGDRPPPCGPAGPSRAPCAGSAVRPVDPADGDASCWIAPAGAWSAARVPGTAPSFFKAGWSHTQNVLYFLCSRAVVLMGCGTARVFFVFVCFAPPILTPVRGWPPET